MISLSILLDLCFWDRSALLQSDHWPGEFGQIPRAFSCNPAFQELRFLSYLPSQQPGWTLLSVVAIRHSFSVSDISVVPSPYSLLNVGIQSKCTLRNTLILPECGVIIDQSFLDRWPAPGLLPGSNMGGLSRNQLATKSVAKCPLSAEAGSKLKFLKGGGNR